MQIRQLEYFVAVSEELNFTKAAQKLYVSQSAITLQIKALEEELEVQLFSRDNRHVELTPAGRSFLDDSYAILRRTKDAAERARRASTNFTGHLNIGFVKGFEKTELSGLLAEFHSDYPNISMKFMRENVGELYDGLCNGSLDFIWNLFYETEDLSGIEFRIFRRYPLVAVIAPSHPLAHRSTIRREELKDYPFIQTVTFDKRYGEMQAIMSKFIESGYVPNTQYISDDVEISILAASIGLGYTLLPSYYTDSLTPSDNVVTVPLEGEDKQIKVAAAWMPNNKNPALSKILSMALPDEFPPK